jgi:hypothetical protein
MIYKRYDGLNGLKECLNSLKDSAVRERVIHGAHQAIKERYNSVQMAKDYYVAYEDALAKAKSQPSLGAFERAQRHWWAPALAAKRRLYYLRRRGRVR